MTKKDGVLGRRAAHGRNRRGYHGQIGDRPPKPWPEHVSSSQSVYTTASAQSRDLKSSGATGGERKRTQAGERSSVAAALSCRSLHKRRCRGRRTCGATRSIRRMPERQQPSRRLGSMVPSPLVRARVCARIRVRASGCAGASAHGQTSRQLSAWTSPSAGALPAALKRPLPAGFAHPPGPASAARAEGADATLDSAHSPSQEVGGFFFWKA